LYSAAPDGRMADLSYELFLAAVKKVGLMPRNADVKLTRETMYL
jgi:hypothetical protein